MASNYGTIKFDDIYNILPDDLKHQVKQIYWSRYVENEARFRAALKMTKIIYPFWCPDYNCFAFFRDDILSDMHIRVKEVIDEVVYTINQISIPNSVIVSMKYIINDIENEYNYYEELECRCMDFVGIDEIVLMYDYFRYPPPNPDLNHFPYLIGHYDQMSDTLIPIHQPIAFDVLDD
ncbi:hypothetical protein [Olea europaea geminivirus]|nr:hypothetical protein [Olea europaea geminivirus]QZR89162.1 BC1 [Olea europaea geminivirus]UDM84302.1 BC1 [Olea europaea geminivirus]UFZ14015.1 hypothetical protein [Olea europaea geminivirus]UFZ14021.1 hypothetical protein [Olea europaea geminivirus]